MANSVEPDETARNKPSHLNLHCLPKYLSWCTGLKGGNSSIGCHSGLIILTENNFRLFLQLLRLHSSTSFSHVVCSSVVPEFVLKLKQKEVFRPPKRKMVFEHVRQAKTQISLRIRCLFRVFAVAIWMHFDPKFLHTD